MSKNQNLYFWRKSANFWSNYAKCDSKHFTLSTIFTEIDSFRDESILFEINIYIYMYVYLAKAIIFMIAISFINQYKYFAAAGIRSSTQWSANVVQTVIQRVKNCEFPQDPPRARISVRRKLLRWNSEILKKYTQTLCHNTFLTSIGIHNHGS